MYDNAQFMSLYINEINIMYISFYRMEYHPLKHRVVKLNAQTAENDKTLLLLFWQSL